MANTLVDKEHAPTPRQFARWRRQLERGDGRMTLPPGSTAPGIVEVGGGKVRGVFMVKKIAKESCYVYMGVRRLGGSWLEDVLDALW